MKTKKAQARILISQDEILNNVRKAHLKVVRERPDSLLQPLLEELGTVRPDESIEDRTERYSDYLDRRQAIIKQHFPDKD